MFSEASQTSRLCGSLRRWLSRALPPPAYHVVGGRMWRTHHAPVQHHTMSQSHAHYSGERDTAVASTLFGPLSQAFLSGHQPVRPTAVSGVPTCKLTPDSPSKREQGAFSWEDTVRRACSTVLGKDPARGVWPWDTCHFLGLKTWPALEYLLWNNLSSEEPSSLGISLLLHASKDTLPACKALVIVTSFFNGFFPVFTKYSTCFFSFSYLFPFGHVCLQWGELDLVWAYYKWANISTVFTYVSVTGLHNAVIISVVFSYFVWETVKY